MCDWAVIGLLQLLSSNGRLPPKPHLVPVPFYQTLMHVLLSTPCQVYPTKLGLLYSVKFVLLNKTIIKMHNISVMIGMFYVSNNVNTLVKEYILYVKAIKI